MANVKILNPEEVSFEEMPEDWLTLKLGEEKFVMDMDTLIDLSFRCASFLAFVEGKEAQQHACVCKNIH